MHTYIVLLRGINVGGKNKIVMTELKLFLERLGFTNVLTYIQSGNVILQSENTAEAVTHTIELNLPKYFSLDSEVIKVLVLTTSQLRSVIKNKPLGFGENHDKYYSDVIFLIKISVLEALTIFSPRNGVDAVWPGQGVIYSQRLAAKRTKSNLSKIMLSPLYKSMTIRNWKTTTKLLALAAGAG